MAFEFIGFLTAPLHMRDVAMCQEGFHRRRSAVTGIRAQVFRTTLRREWPFDLHGIEHGLQLRHIMSMRPGHDERQRDATTVDQQMALTPIFSPDP